VAARLIEVEDHRSSLDGTLGSPIPGSFQSRARNESRPKLKKTL
jgi:hypothetical protein